MHLHKLYYLIMSFMFMTWFSRIHIKFVNDKWCNVSISLHYTIHIKCKDLANTNILPLTSLILTYVLNILINKNKDLKKYHPILYKLVLIHCFVNLYCTRTSALYLYIALWRSETCNIRRSSFSIAKKRKLFNEFFLSFYFNCRKIILF